MRILSFSESWSKLQQDTFTTFRFPRRDKDWTVGEFVQIVYKPRSKERKLLGIAKIVGKEPRRVFPAMVGDCLTVSDEEAVEDGFDSAWEMSKWLDKIYGIRRPLEEPMNKLTLQWRLKAK